MIDTLIFDVGNVLVDTHTEAARNELCVQFRLPLVQYLELTRSDFSGPGKSVTELAILGKLTTRDYLEAFSKRCRSPISDAMIRKNRLSVIGRERSAMVRFLARLRKSYRIVLFSNTIELHWDFITRSSDYSFLQNTDFVFASNEIGLGKPLRESFEYVLSTIGSAEYKVLFVDDLLINVVAARAMGIESIQFDTLMNLEAELRKHLVW